MKELIEPMHDLQEAYLIYDSLTGNTKKVVDALSAQLREDEVKHKVLSIKEAMDFPFTPSDSMKRLYIFATWVDRSSFSPQMHKFIEKRREELSWGKHAFVATAGWIQDPYPDKIMANMAQDFANKVGTLRLVAQFVCQGKMRESTKKRYLSGKDRHATSPQMVQIKLDNWERALEHPNLQDIEHARSWMADIYA